MDQAEGDLIHAQNDAEHGFYDWSCFSAQQAAANAVKAVFQRLGGLGPLRRGSIARVVALLFGSRRAHAGSIGVG